jgi:yeast amino acid transporter
MHCLGEQQIFELSNVLCSAASETENPRRNISKAVRRVFWRIVIFYLLGILMTGMLVPYDDPALLNGTNNASQSPYVIAIRRAGIHTLPSIINAAIFTSAFSAGNSFLFCSSRILYGLAIRGQAPRVFTYCTKNGLPIVSVLFCVCLSLWSLSLALTRRSYFCLHIQCCFSLFSFMNVSSGAAKVFECAIIHDERAHCSTARLVLQLVR